MWKKIIFLMIAGLFFLQSGNLFAGAERLKKLRSKYPYGLLGEDFGILKEEDLAIDTCIADPIPFSEASTSYPYWQCFEVSQTKIACEGNKYDASEKTRLALLVVSGVRKDGLHEYFHDRTMPSDACREFIRDWTRLLKGQQHVCVSGAFAKRERDKTGRLVSQWDFDRFKTKVGCSSYFEGGCSLSYQKRVHGCKEESLAARKFP